FIVWFVFVRYIFFFFQAEDGIRDRNVTGVQTCALPISRPAAAASESGWQSLPSLLRVCRRQVRRAAAVLVLWPKPLRPRFVSALPVEHWTPDRGDMGRSHSIRVPPLLCLR